MNREALLDTISRLLALGDNNPNEHEAKAALAKAQQLMLEHDIAYQDLKADESDWGKCVVFEGKRMPIEVKLATAVICEAFGVKGVIKAGRRNDTAMGIYGRQHRVKVAVYGYVYLTRVMAQQAKGVAKRDRGAFILGMAEGFRDKLVSQLRASGQNMLAVSRQEVEDHLAERGVIDPKDKVKLPAIRGDVGAYVEGYVAGQELNVNEAVTGATERKALGR